MAQSRWVDEMDVNKLPWECRYWITGSNVPTLLAIMQILKQDGAREGERAMEDRQGKVGKCGRGTEDIDRRNRGLVALHTN